MKKRSRKIRKIVSLASAEETRAGAAAGLSRRKLEEHLSKLGELNAFRHDYAALSKSMSAVGAAHWKDYQSFLARLDQAVKSQQQIVRDSESNLDAHRRRWAAKRQRLESLQRVLDSYHSLESQHAERLQQRALDDLPKSDPVFDDREED